MARSATFDYRQHNQKIAGMRGDGWKKKLQQSKLDASKNPTALKVRRVSMGLSQDDMLQLIEVNTQTTYARIERGERFASKERAEKIARALNASVKQLFIQSDENKFLAI